jgi:hypothetical protein
MATLAVRQARLQDERRFFTGTAATLVAATFVGFAPTYYLSHFTAAPGFGPLVHVHGALFSAWMLLYLAQTGLIAGGRPGAHRRIGMGASAIAVAVFVVGVVVAIESGRLGHGPPGRNQPVFLIFPLSNILAFAAFTALGVIRRRRSDHHKRLMLLGTLSLVVTPLARISVMMGWPLPPPVGGMILSDIFLAALVAFDLRKDGRLHPVTLWGGGALLLSQPLRVAIGNSEGWQALARTMIA